MLPHKFNSVEEEIEYLKSLFNGNESKNSPK